MDKLAFREWLQEMKSADLARSDVACARLLNVTAHTVVQMKQRGADRRTALACRALLHRMTPYGDDIRP